MPRVAFYKGKGTWVDWAIRTVTRSPYSHVELIPDPLMQGADGSFLCYTSSPRDGGVVNRSIGFKRDHWDFVDVEWYAPNVIAIFDQYAGAKYDYAGIIFSQFFNWRTHSRKRWFCSEIIAAALDLPNPTSYSPGSLKAMLDWLNEWPPASNPKGK